MSYCRWSTDDFQCDLYIYEDVSGGWTTHIAGNRLIWHEGVLPAPVTYDTDPEGFFNRMVEIQKLMPVDQMGGNDNFHREGIELPFAGETFNDPTPGACADRLVELFELGYHFPIEIIAELREEQEEMDQGLADLEEISTEVGGDPCGDLEPGDEQLPLARQSSVFERPPGNVYHVPEGVIPEAMMEKFDD